MKFCWPSVVLCASSILSGAVAADLDTREALFDFKADVTIDGRRLQPVGVR